MVYSKPEAYSALFPALKLPTGLAAEKHSFSVQLSPLLVVLCKRAA